MLILRNSLLKVYFCHSIPEETEAPIWTLKLDCACDINKIRLGKTYKIPKLTLLPLKYVIRRPHDYSIEVSFPPNFLLSPWGKKNSDSLQLHEKINLNISKFFLFNKESDICHVIQLT